MIAHFGYWFRGWYPTWCMRVRGFHTADWLLLGLFAAVALRTVTMCWKGEK